MIIDAGCMVFLKKCGAFLCGFVDGQALTDLRPDGMGWRKPGAASDEGTTD
jgi:hypothetical protein